MRSSQDPRGPRCGTGLRNVRLLKRPTPQTGPLGRAGHGLGTGAPAHRESPLTAAAHSPPDGGGRVVVGAAHASDHDDRPMSTPIPSTAVAVNSTAGITVHASLTVFIASFHCRPVGRPGHEGRRSATVAALWKCRAVSALRWCAEPCPGAGWLKAGPAWVRPAWWTRPAVCAGRGCGAGRARSR